MIILETERLTLREIDDGDAEFTLDLLNQPSFIKYIGDRQVRTLDEARDFIENRYRASYREHGFGLYVVELKTELAETGESPAALGICGFVKRETLPEPDIGFAFLPQHGKKGYAVESAAAMMKYGRETLGLGKILAITTPDNESSGRLLEKIGFRFDRLIESGEEQLKLFVSE